MAKKNNLQTITAQHVTRTDKDGNLLVKSFTAKAWNDLPMVHYMSKEEGLVKRAKGGWVEIGKTTGAKAPEPLAKKEAPVQRPVAPRPTPRTEDYGTEVK